MSTDEGKQWVDIQLHTFANWMNQQLGSEVVRDLPEDLSDGVLLIRLVEAVQGRRYFGKIYDENPTEIQKLMNVQMALDALREDGVKTVNIGSHDIVEGNTKLILGLMWSIVQRYQIASRTKIPPKKLVMAWMQSVLPELKLTNFRTNWNDGRALSALLEFCQPGLCPEWNRLDRSEGLENCRRALLLADQFLGVPRIILPEHLNSPHLDELSAITYLSYFIIRGGPGYRATLQRAQSILPDIELHDVDDSWSDGYLLSLLIMAVADQKLPINEMHFETFKDCVTNVGMALDAAVKIGVGSLVGPEDIADPQGEHLGTMALVAALCAVSPSPQATVTQCFVNQQVNLDLAFAEGNEVRVDDLNVKVVGPSGRELSSSTLRLRKSRTSAGAVLSLVPSDEGFHQVRIFCQGSELPSSPISLHVLSADESRAASRVANSRQQESRQQESRPERSSPVKVERNDSDVDISHKSFAQRRLQIIKQLEAHTQPPPPAPAPSQPSKKPVEPVLLEASAHREMPLTRSGVADVGLVSFSGLSEPCSVGSIVEVVINAHGDVSSGTVYVDAVGPSGKVINCKVDHRRNSYMATFTPDEVGLWKIGILYEGEHIRGSPFSCNVFDSSLVNVYGLDVGLVGQELRFSVDTRQAGAGQPQVSVYHNGHEIPASILAHGEEHRVNFVPDGAGQYKIHVLFNRMEVKGSPFILDIADASSVSVYGENLRVASVGREASFQVHAVGADPKDVSVVINAPSGKVAPVGIHPMEDASYRIAWTPVEPGEHMIDVRLYDQSVYESPFTCNVGAPERVAVRGMPRRLQASRDLNTDQSFEIDASSAGSGNLEIMVNGGRVECRVKEIGSRQYLAIFTPTQSITHTVEMRFNGQEVPGSPWKIPVEEKPSERRQDMSKTQSFYSELCGAGLVRAPVGRTAAFEISGDGLELPDIRASIYGPDGKEFPVRIIPRGNGKHTAEYRIENVGEHQLTVWISGRKVDGSPLPVAGYSPDNVKIEPLGGGAVGSPVQFIVDAVDAGKGQLEISVNQGRVPNNVQMQGAGRCLVTFIPQHPGTYVIDVSFNGEAVHGCPIKVEILPKQVGQTVQANLTPTAVSAAVNAGGTASISSAFRQSRSPASPTSPTLLRHARQRSEEAINPRSPTLLRDARGRQEQPWKSSYAPTSSRMSSSVSPNRQWTAGSVYDRIYGSPTERDRTTERTLSPSDPTRSHVFAETTTTTTYGRTPSPTGAGVRSREFAERMETERTTSPGYEQRYESSTSPGHYEHRYDSPFGSKTRDIPIRSPSPPKSSREQPSPYGITSVTSRDHSTSYGRTASPGVGERIRQMEPKATATTTVTSHYTSPYVRSPSPPPGEKIRQIERIDPLAEEEAREQRRRDEMAREKAPSGVGYTVAQYGEPGDRTGTQVRHFGDTLERTRTPETLERNKTPTRTERITVDREKVTEKTTDPTTGRSGSPEYATVYERYERTTKWEEDKKVAPQPPVTPPPVFPHKETERHEAQPPPSRVISPPEREPSPDYGEKGVTSVLRKYEPGFADLSDGRPRHEYENIDRKPEVPRRAATPEGNLDDYRPSARREEHFTRTQSELLPQDRDEDHPIHRTEEKESIYDMPPKVSVTTASEDERREQELARVRAEDDQILGKLGFQRKVIHDKSIEIEEPMEDIRDDVVETAGSREHLSDRPSHALQSLEPVQELPHSPAPSTKSTPATTPRTSAKFNQEGKDQKKKFDFGKSKFSSKHEVVKRGKEVDVKLDSLKLGKEDVLRVVVMAPIRAQSSDEPKEVETKVKKSGSKYEISFKPSDVGTHKVFAYVNDVQHPTSPFAIRVYDSSQIVVGDIPSQSHLNDTVEFTVDAGRAGFGNLEMAIKDSDGVIIPSHVAQLEQGSAKFLVTFTPSSKGPHTVNITFNKEVLKNSPFEVMITDPAVHHHHEKSAEAPVGSPLLSKKEMKKEKEEKKKEEKERVKREKEEKMATLKGQKKGKHKHITKTQVTKIPSLSRLGQPSSIIVEVAGGDQLLVTVTDNKKNQLGTEITEIEPGVMQIEFTPTQVGDYEIDVRYAGVPVNGSPFTCRAYDPAQIKVGTIPKGLIDKEVVFTVDASEAGVGNLEVAVNDGRVPSQARALGGHKYDISFVPKDDVDHTISVRFNNEPVPGSPFICQLVNTTKAHASGPGLERIPVDEEAQIFIESTDDAAPVVRVRDAQATDMPVATYRKDASTMVATFTPKCVGNHQIDISVLGEPIPGSPFTAKAFDSKQAKLTPCEPASVGKPTTFVIDAARAGAGNMEIIVSVDGRNVPNFVQSEGQAKFKVSFTPQEAKDHVISVKFNGQSVPGSPMICQVDAAAPIATMAPVVSTGLTGAAPVVQRQEKTGLTKELAGIQIGQKKGFTIPNPGRSKDCNVIITDPVGGPLPVKCYKQADDSYWVEFTPELTGPHNIEITFDNVPVSGSPFRCDVVDLRKVAVRGIDDSLVLRHATTMTVQRGEAGTGDLQVEITDPSGSPLRVEMLKSPGGDDRFTFLPNKTGPHKINVRMAGFPLPGYPQTVMVGEMEHPTVYGAAMDQSVKIGEPGSIIFDPKKQNGGLKVSVTGPNERKLRHNVMRRPNGTSEVVFYPEEVGAHKVAIDFNNKPLNGSPFSIRVVDPSKVLVSDLDMDRDGSLLLRLGQENFFDVDATAAGPGKLRAEVRDAEDVLLGDGPVVHDLGYGKCRVSFKPPKPDRYSIYLYWNELPVESAFPVRARYSKEEPALASTSRQGYGEPRQVYGESRQGYAEMTPEQERRSERSATHTTTTATHIMHTREKSASSSHEDDIERVIVRGDGLHRAMLKEANEFIVDGSDLGREGRLTATLLGQKVDIPVRIQQVGHNVYKANYTPLTGGTYELHVLWNGKHVNGSPFKVLADSSTVPADLITVDGSTLKIGIVNDELKTLIDTRRAGPGQLSANCMGPVKPAYCELYDHRDGTYTLNVRPSEVGKHTLTVKYNDAHVRGSPFLIHVSLPPDPSKVRVYGPGIEHGILSLFKSNFVVETRGAGAGQLTVRVRGPKGAFNVEMQREKKNERTIHCKYEPKEPGDYQVEVKWHGEHVPGSPFFVMIMDTEQELARFLRGEMPSPSPATPFVPPGWVGPPPPMFHPMGHPPPRGYMGPPMPPMGPPGPMVPYGAPTPPRHKSKYH